MSVNQCGTDEQTVAISDDGPCVPYEVEATTTAFRILIVDDVPVNVKVARAHLESVGYSDIVSVTDATQVLSTVYRDDPDILLLDIMMPEVSGLEILQTLRADERYARLPVLILTGAESRELKTEALRLGATDFLTKPVDPEDLIPRVRNALLVKSYQDNLERKVRERTTALEKSQQEIIHCLARAAEYRDNDTGNHVVRVGRYASLTARELGLDDRHVRLIEQAAVLHDVGKIGIPDAILLKPGKLTPEEFEIIQKHCGFGKKIFQALSQDEYGVLMSHTTLGASIVGCDSPLLEMARTIALTHHEKWDGTGYPLGLAGEDIPIEGRITAVADVFDALGSVRPYKPAFPLEKCLAILKEERGKHFEPRVVDAFLARKQEVVAIQIAHAETD